VAQRPLPSIITPTWRGRRSLSIWFCSSISVEAAKVRKVKEEGWQELKETEGSNMRTLRPTNPTFPRMLFWARTRVQGRFKGEGFQPFGKYQKEMLELNVKTL
jgi:hypothetical protein